jgi:hypothetical protein
MGRKFNYKKNWSNCWKWFFISCWNLWMFLKFWRWQKHECRECDWEIIENNKGKGSSKEWAQTKTKGRSGIVEKNKSRRGVEKSKMWRRVEYLVIGCKVVATFIIIFGMCRRKAYNEKIQFAQMIIHDIYWIKTFAVEFLSKSKRN